MSPLNISLQKRTPQAKSTNSSLLYTIVCILACYYGEANQFQIMRTSLNQNTLNNQITVNFNEAFSALPKFSYIIQDLNVQSQQLYLNHSSIQLKQNAIKINFNCFFYRTSISAIDNTLGQNQQITIIIMATDYSKEIQLGIKNSLQINISSSQITYYNTYSAQIQYRILVYALCLPFLYEITSSSQNNSTLSILTSPTLISTTISVSYIVVTQIHILSTIFCIFDQFRQNSLNYILIIDSEGYLKPLVKNIFIGLKGLKVPGTSITLTQYTYFDYYHAPAASKGVKIGYQPIDKQITDVKSVVIAFNNDFNDGCISTEGNVGYFAYQKLFETVPYACIGCHWTCLKCVASEIMSYTDENYCTSCQTGRYFQPDSTGTQGVCHCLKGLEIDQNGVCIPCVTNCLTFLPQFMRASSSPKFLLVFTYSQLIFDMELQQNMEISIDSEKVEYNLTLHRKGAYIIEVNKTLLKSCQQSCEVSFYFKVPHYVRTQQKYLTDQLKVLEIRNLYIVEQMMPQNLEEVFFIIGSFISVSAAAGQSSFLKVLFELQQLIQFHKYLNLDIPVVFKQFLQALSTFKFMDIMSLLPFDVNKYMQDLSSDSLDLKGSAKIIYYENGVNFYKNCVPIILSFGAILLINFVFFLILRMIPFKLFQTLANKLRIRWIITLSDMIESLVLPIVFFALYQNTFMVLNSDIIWINILSFLLSFLLIIFPFFPLTYTMINTQYQKDSLMREILEDLFQDCNTSYTMTYITYVYSFLRKVLCSIFLLSPLPGFIQVSGMLLANIVQFLIIIYLIKQGIFISKTKIFTRTLNILCVISIQFLIMTYNMNYSKIDGMILIGIACTYFAIISAVMGLLQMVIKIFDIIFQKLRSDISKAEVLPQIFKNQYVRNAKCKIGKPLKNTKQPQNQSEKMYKEDEDASSLDNMSELVPIQSDDGFTNYGSAEIVPSQLAHRTSGNDQKKTSQRYQNPDIESHSSGQNSLIKQNSSQNEIDKNRSLYKRLKKIKKTREQKLQNLVISQPKNNEDSMSDIIQINYDENQFD